MTTTSKKNIEFEYCECGCHGHYLSLPGNSYWIYNDLKGTYFLHKGHGMYSPLIGKFSSHYDAAISVYEQIQADIKFLKSFKKPKQPKPSK